MSVTEASSPDEAGGKTVFSLLSNIKDHQDTPQQAPTTLQIEVDEDIAILRHDPETNEKVINKSAYLKLHKSLSPDSTSTVDKIKEKFENQPPSETVESLKSKYSPAALGYTKKPSVKPRKSKLSKSQIIIPSKRDQVARRSLNIEPKKRSDINSNELRKNSKEDNDEYITIITRSDSDESVSKFEKELSAFTMDKKKRASSFRKIFSVFSGKDKRRKGKSEAKQNGDNFQNESAFSRQATYRHTTGGERDSKPRPQRSDSDPKDIEIDFHQLHIKEFKPSENTFRQKNTEFTPMDKPSYNTYMNVPNVRRYIDTSSSASTLESDRSIFQQNRGDDEVEVRNSSTFRPSRISDNRRDTPPRLMETIKSDVRLVNPKALIPINSERPPPNPYQDSPTSPVSPNNYTISKPLSQSTPTGRPYLEDTYGTVLDSLDNLQRMSRSNLVEATKLKLPPNRQIVPLSPRVKSPIPSDIVSTDKIIATELLKSKRPPTPNKEHQRMQNSDIDYANNINNSRRNLANKPPISDKSPVNLQLLQQFQRHQQPELLPHQQETESRRTSQTRSSNESVVLRNATPNYQYMSQQNLSSRRPVTPSGNQIPDSPKTTPQKEDIRKSVEAYYWKEIKKLKDQENYQLYMMQMQYGYIPDDAAANVRRSRSMSPVTSRNGRRSLSLPREARPPLNIISDTYYSNIIPENAAVIQPRSMQQLQFQQQQQQYFQRNTPERSTIDGTSVRKVDGTNSLYRPIFKRGSLSSPPVRQVTEDSLKRKVSFSGGQEQALQGWPTRNGFTQSPPQKRLEKLPTQGDDEVFFPPRPTEESFYYNRPEESVYYTSGKSNYVEPRYVLRASQNSLYFQQRQPIENPYRVRASAGRQESLYGQSVGPPLPLSRRGSIQIQEDPYGHLPATSKTSMARRPLVRREIIVNDEIFGQIGGYAVSTRQPGHHYPQKQVSVNNKVCDIYGQIHDSEQIAVQQSGVLMGQVQKPPENFVRNSRITASANDMYRRVPPAQRYPNEALYGRIEQTGPPTRPLPPVPLKKGVISDTESGSDASEVQRILNHSKSNKKRGIFSK